MVPTFTRANLHPGVCSVEEPLLGVVLGDVLEQPQEVEQEAGLVRDEEVDQDAACRGSIQWCLKLTYYKSSRKF